MKKIIVILATIFMFVTGFSNVFACEENTCMALDETIDFYIDPAYQNELQSKQNRTLYRTSTTLNVRLLNQNDSRWKDEALNGCSDETIGSAGCALTSMTMVYNYIKGKSKTPADINSEFVVCPMPWSNFATHYGFSRVACGNITNSEAYSTIKTYLDNSDPVVARLQKGTNNHYVVVYGYNSNGNTLYLRDPDTRSGFTTLASAISAGWSITYYHVFS